MDWPNEKTEGEKKCIMRRNNSLRPRERYRDTQIFTKYLSYELVGEQTTPYA